ncbi:17107_t:CDS:2 [Funneliformis caledonium]|uniref:17107_t:CDS:1 n=1 Tax=Funneliformis caledonium TaxID=1117310 RepID=A0A9N9AWG9_9GLOM|nr:17107_t:CDS:2 [Funneliformis caledonium]
MNLGYNTLCPSQPGLCDQYKLSFIDDNSIMFICDYAYHSDYYHGRCIYYEEFYKKGVVKNIELFLKQIEKSADVFTLEDLVNYNTEIETEDKDEDNSGKIDETLDILSKLTIEINQIESW